MSIEGEAKGLMTNEAFLDALKKAKDANINAALRCKPRDDLGRWKYLEAAKIVDGVAAHLHALIIASKTGDTVDPANFYEERAGSVFARILNR